MTDECDHGINYDAECATCESEIAEARAAGATTPFEIGLYWKGRAEERERVAQQHPFRRAEQLRAERDALAERIARAERLIDSWEHDAPDHSNPVFIGRLRECLRRDPAPVRLRGDECDHHWLDRPESDTRECLVCGLEVAG